jgi:hypothetical protein
MAIPIAGILFIGLLPQFAIRPISIVAEAVTGQENTIAVDHFNPTLTTLSYISITLIVVIVALYLLKRRAQRSRKIEEGPTWGCGFTAPNERMQYTGESFSEGLESITKPLMNDTVDGRSVDKSEIFPTEHNYRIRHNDKVDSILAQWWVKMMHRLNKYVMKLRTGRVNNYITFALVFLIAVLVMTLFNLL